MSTSELNNLDESDEYPPRRSSSEQNVFDDQTPPFILDDEDDEPIPPAIKPRRTSHIPKLKQSKPLSKSMIIPSNKFSSKTARTIPARPSVGRHAVQGVLVRFFRNGEVHHPGAKVAINELEIKSWEAFLNYLNRQPRLALASGGIRHVYTLNGQEIRSINKFQNRQTYVIASGMFIRTNYRHMNDAFNDDVEANSSSNGNGTTSTVKRWQSPSLQTEQIFLLPYSRLNMYESLLLNRNLTISFEQWLKEEVTDLLSRYVSNDVIAYLYAIKKMEFTEVKSFSQLFNTLKVTDTFIGCTEEEFEHSKRYLATMRPDDFFGANFWLRKNTNGFKRYNPKQTSIDAKLSINAIYGYDATKEQTRKLYSLSEHEILYVMNTVCILYQTDTKQQRFYTKHQNPITCVTVHQCHSLVASNEINSIKDRSRIAIHIWDYDKLQTLTELRKETFGSDVTLLSFSPKPDDNLLLVVSRDKPKLLFIVDWKRHELMYNIPTKSDRILSALFAFGSIEWLACISQQRLQFYNINWHAKPVGIALQRESEVQNIYTGAAASDPEGERLIIGDKVGSVHVWQLIENEPRLMEMRESILENDVQIIVALDKDSFILANGHNQIKLWNVKSNTIEQIRLKDTFGTIQSVCSIRDGFAVGTKMNYILSKELHNEQIEIIMRGHTNPSICICCNKNSEHFYSIDSDRYLFKWNKRTKLVEWSIKSPQLISCAALHPERNIIVLGTETSKLLIYDTLSSYYVTTILLKISTGVKSVRFSPDGRDVAIGLQNGMIWIFDVVGNGDFQLRTDGSAQYHNAPVTDVIWSVDSNYLLGVYDDNNYNIWSIPSFDMVRGKNIQSIPWHQVVHPIACSILDKFIADAQSSAIVLSSNLVLCCGKDGQLRLFRNFYERYSQIVPTGFGPIQSVIPSAGNDTFLLSISNDSTLVEVQINIET